MLQWRAMPKLLVCLLILAAPGAARVKTGLDILIEEDFAPIAGKRIGVVANDNSRAADHRNIVASLASSPKVKLTAIFAPEHGFAATAQAGADIASGKD